MQPRALLGDGVGKRAVIAGERMRAPRFCKAAKQGCIAGVDANNAQRHVGMHAFDGRPAGIKIGDELKRVRVDADGQRLRVRGEHRLDGVDDQRGG